MICFRHCKLHIIDNIILGPIITSLYLKSREAHLWYVCTSTGLEGRDLCFHYLWVCRSNQRAKFCNDAHKYTQKHVETQMGRQRDQTPQAQTYE